MCENYKIKVVSISQSRHIVLTHLPNSHKDDDRGRVLIKSVES